MAAAVAGGVARVDPRAAVRPHAPAVLEVNVERLRFFDPATGAATGRRAGPGTPGARERRICATP